MHFTDATPVIRGSFELHVFHHTEQGRQLVETYHEHNLVVNVGKTTLAQLLGNDGANKAVTQIGVGTNGTAPTAGDVALTNAFTKAIDTHSYPGTGQVQFDWSIGTAEANGKAIQEFGLLSADGTLFARRTRGAIQKESDISLAGSWTITIS